MDITKYRPSFVRDSEKKQIGFAAGRVCLMCPNKLDTHTKYYCSGGCMQKAKTDNVYGNEDKTIAAQQHESN